MTLSDNSCMAKQRPLRFGAASVPFVTAPIFIAAPIFVTTPITVPLAALWQAAKVALVGSVLALAGCEGAVLPGDTSSSDSAGSLQSSSQVQSSSQASSSSLGVADPDPLANCEAPEGLTMTNIDSVVTWINAMPKPLSLACFVKTIPRPMYYNATLSTFSAQPSIGRRSPRVFFFIGDLVLTVVPDETTSQVKDPETGEIIETWDADNKQLLELALEVESDFTHRQSIKGEIAFPVTEELPASAPYAHIFFQNNNNISNCAFCHADEIQVDTIDDVPVYRSQMLRNNRETEVALPFMLNQNLYCDPEFSEHEAYRCTMLEAIYGQGRLVWRSFPDDIPTIFDN